MSTENAAFTSFWCARQLSGFRVIIFCLLSSLSRRWICQPCFRSSARIANTGSRASDAATEVERPDIRPTTNNGRKISVVVVRRRRQSRLGAGRRSPAMLVCHPGCSDGKWMAAECAAGTPPCFGAALRCNAPHRAAPRARHKWGAVKPVIYRFSERCRSPAIWPPPGRKGARPPRRLHPGRNFLPEWLGPTRTEPKDRRHRTGALQGADGGSRVRLSAIDSACRSDPCCRSPSCCSPAPSCL